MKYTLFLVTALYVLFSVPQVVASPSCQGCNIVAEGLFNRDLANHYVFYKRGTDDYVKVTIEGIDVPKQMVLWQDANGVTGWDYASHYYSETSVAEDRRADFEDSQKAGLAASCAAYVAARDEGSLTSLLVAAAMRGACCDSTAARTYGSPPGLC
jgi:hypothetical protein